MHMGRGHMRMSDRNVELGLQRFRAGALPEVLDRPVAPTGIPASPRVLHCPRVGRLVCWSLLIINSLSGADPEA